MMNPKVLVLYVIAGVLSLLLIIYQLVSEYPNPYMPRIILNIIMCLVFFYLAYKTYHEKKDKELM
jgi:hypothetical protein